MPGMCRDNQDRFGARHRDSVAHVQRTIEREALGSDYGANGYTTLAQAEALGEQLGLDGRSKLLDLGSGCGYPGLYLAGRYGCAVISVDPVMEGVRVAVDRARRDGLAGRALALCADAGAPPVRDRSVDAVVHVDLMC